MTLAPQVTVMAAPGMPALSVFTDVAVVPTHALDNGGLCSCRDAAVHRQAVLADVIASAEALKPKPDHRARPRANLTTRIPLNEADIMPRPRPQALGLTPASLLRVFGLRRAGNHAVIDWLLRNAPGSGTVFLNDCAPHKDPLISFGHISVNDERRRAKRVDPQRLPEFLSGAGESPTILISYEDHLPTEDEGNRPVSTGIAKEDFDREILITRSFLNWLASFLVLHRKTRHGAPDQPLRAMRTLLEEVTLYQSAIRQAAEGFLPGTLHIDFDRWAASESYRADLLADLGYTAHDNSLGEAQIYGAGSSFASETTDITQRWRAMRDDPDYRTVVTLVARDARFLKTLDVVYPDDVRRIHELAS